MNVIRWAAALTLLVLSIAVWLLTVPLMLAVGLLNAALYAVATGIETAGRAIRPREPRP